MTATRSAPTSVRQITGIITSDRNDRREMGLIIHPQAL